MPPKLEVTQGLGEPLEEDKMCVTRCGRCRKWLDDRGIAQIPSAMIIVRAATAALEGASPVQWNRDRDDQLVLQFWDRGKSLIGCDSTLEPGFSHMSATKLPDLNDKIDHRRRVVELLCTLNKYYTFEDDAKEGKYHLVGGFFQLEEKREGLLALFQDKHIVRLLEKIRVRSAESDAHGEYTIEEDLGVKYWPEF